MWYVLRWNTLLPQCLSLHPGVYKNEEYNTEIEKKTFYIVSEYNVGGGEGGGGGGDFNLKKNFDRYIIKLNYAFIWIPSWYQRNSWQAN